jgi:hypothetical protein
MPTAPPEAGAACRNRQLSDGQRALASREAGGRFWPESQIHGQTPRKPFGLSAERIRAS